MIFKKIPILIVLCATASILVILFYLLGYNILTVPPKTSEQLLEDHMQIDNVTSEKIRIFFPIISRNTLQTFILPVTLVYINYNFNYDS